MSARKLDTAVRVGPSAVDLTDLGWCSPPVGAGAGAGLGEATGAGAGSPTGLGAGVVGTAVTGGLAGVVLVVLPSPEDSDPPHPANISKAAATVARCSAGLRSLRATALRWKK